MDSLPFGLKNESDCTGYERWNDTYCIPGSNTTTCSCEPLPAVKFNFSLTEVINIVSENTRGSYLGSSAKIIIMTLYIILISVGLLGNVAVALVIAKKHETIAARNLYVINLAISDITLCLICMPFTLASLMEKNWSLGTTICKLIPVLQCSNILVSTATIVAIATDRYLTIVRVGCRPRPQYWNKISLAAIWIVSLLFPLPLFRYYYLERVMLKDFLLFEKCVEKWSSFRIQMAWIGTLVIIQYLIPISVLFFVHIRIKRFLSKHKVSGLGGSRKFAELDRNRRTTILLTTIAVVFAVSWLPWHVVNFLADFNYFQNPESFYAIFGGCHILAMSTACTNPVLYGWLNTNLRREIKGVMASVLKSAVPHCSHHTRDAQVPCQQCSSSRKLSLKRLSLRSGKLSPKREEVGLSPMDAAQTPNSAISSISCNEIGAIHELPEKPINDGHDKQIIYDSVE